MRATKSCCKLVARFGNRVHNFCKLIFLPRSIIPFRQRGGSKLFTFYKFMVPTHNVNNAHVATNTIYGMFAFATPPITGGSSVNLLILDSL